MNLQISNKKIWNILKETKKKMMTMIVMMMMIKKKIMDLLIIQSNGKKLKILM